MVKRIDILLIGIAIILLTMLAVVSVAFYEETTGTRMGYYALGFMPLIVLGIFLIMKSFTKKE